MIGRIRDIGNKGFYCCLQGETNSLPIDINEIRQYDRENLHKGLSDSYLRFKYGHMVTLSLEDNYFYIWLENKAIEHLQEQLRWWVYRANHNFWSRSQVQVEKVGCANHIFLGSRVLMTFLAPIFWWLKSDNDRSNLCLMARMMSLSSTWFKQEPMADNQKGQSVSGPWNDWQLLEEVWHRSLLAPNIWWSHNEWGSGSKILVDFWILALKNYDSHCILTMYQ